MENFVEKSPSSALVNSTTCQQCAKCCLRFWFYEVATNETRDLLTAAQAMSAQQGVKQIRTWATTSEDVDKRLDLLDTANTHTDWLSFREIAASDGQQKFEIIMAIPCGKLEQTKDGYLCSIWGEPLRPELCATYPSNQYANPQSQTLYGDHARMEKIHANASPHCPILAAQPLKEILQKPLYN